MAKYVREPAKAVPVVGEYDVVVLGGGPAGVGAAVAAARAKASVLLVEQTGCLGGMGTSGLVPCFAPLGAGAKPVIEGIATEVIRRLRKINGLGEMKEELPYVPVDAEKLKLVYDELAAEAGVKVMYFTLAADVIRRGRRITHVILQSKAGRQAVAAGAFIDATGDADVAALAGAGFDKGDERGRMQAAALCYMVAGVDLAVYHRFVESLGDRLAWFRKLQASGDLPTIPKTEYRGMCPSRLTPWLGTVNFAHIFDVDGCNPEDLSRVMTSGRKMAHAFIEYARKHVPGMKNARLVATAALPGIRETRRIHGRRRLTKEDFFAARHFPDDIASYDFRIDVHNASGNLREVKQYAKDYAQLTMPPGKTYGIPLSCLLPKGLDNLAVAGRSLSADREMHGSARVMTASFAMGQAAGLAAAMAVKGKKPLHKVDIAELRRRLKKAGARI